MSREGLCFRKKIEIGLSSHNKVPNARRADFQHDREKWEREELKWTLL